MKQASAVPRDRAVRQAFGQRLNELKGDDTWYALAQRTQLHETYLKNLAAGERDPSLSTLIKLMRGLKLCSIEELLGPMPSTLLARDLAIDSVGPAPGQRRGKTLGSAVP